VTARIQPRWVYWLPAAAWAVVIFVLSSISRLPAPPGGLTDKHAHAITFGVLTLACLYGLTAGHWRRVGVSTVVLAIALAVAYGVTDELHQAFVPGRTADLADVAADAVGAVVAGLGAWGCAILLRARRSSRGEADEASANRP
jgi:VanZ family protein